MRQVPVRPNLNSSDASARFTSRPCYLIIGNGRVANHLKAYFNYEKIAFHQSYRSADQAFAESLPELAHQATHVLIAINDSAIEEFYLSHPCLWKKLCIHFSGAMSFPNIIGTHPLMSFSDELYDLETYRSIPFILEKERREGFVELFPQLKNPHFEISLEKKVLYHALCVLSGNFTIMLWEKTIADFATKLQLPRAALLPYMARIFENLKNASTEKTVLTGPLVRGDQATVEKHLEILSGDPYCGVYEAFATAYRKVDSQKNKGARS